VLDQLQIRRPHIRADKFDLAGQLRADDREELSKALGGALLADSQQSGARALDLVDQREELMSSSILDLIDADGTDRC